MNKTRPQCVQALASLVAAYVFLGGSSVPAQGEPDTAVYRIQSRWYPNEFLSDSEGTVRHSPGEGNSFLWVLVDRGEGLYGIRNQGTGRELRLEGETALATAAGDAGSASRWVVDVVSGEWVSIRSAANQRFVNIERRRGVAECDLAKAPSDKDRWSAQWRLVHTGGPVPPPFARRHQIAVQTPAYGADIQGPTTITVLAPGFRELAARCWQHGEGQGRDAAAGTILLDASGKGTFVFPADDFPNGPITVRLYAENADAKDQCRLQLYNRGGKRWKQGASTLPPQAAGMRLAFVDEFDGPVSVSSDGKDARYAAHKPGGGDFSGIPFTDPEKPNSPFLQRDTFLRIRADANQKSTGLISSLRLDGTGITAKAPCYFECRFVAQNSIGTWPAFWVMTTGVHKGLKEPADELDVIEAYGVRDRNHQNNTGYMIASHYWNQGADGKKDYSQPRVYQYVPMTKLEGASGATWDQTFNVYGVKVGLDETLYYCNDIEVARHKTARLSAREPFFFLVNLAVGGASGWPTDLSRYNGIADLYVDYVRVFQGQ